jgi:HAMP domain-containing protein
MDTAYISGLFALLGTLLGLIVSLAISNRTERTQERKHFRELGMQIALLNYKNRLEMAQKISDLTHSVQEIPPFPLFVIEGIRTMEIVGDTRLTAKEVGRRISELFAFYKAVAKETEQQTRDAREGDATPGDSTARQ